MLQGKHALIGPDVFFNPASFLKDLNHVQENGFNITGKIIIDERAHVIMPYHIRLDNLTDKIGSTKRGIGQAAKDKAERTTNITVADMISENFERKIKAVIESKKEELLNKGIINGKRNVARYAQRTHEVYSGYAEKIKKYVGSGIYTLNDQIKKNKRIILEGAQGTLLDVVHGTRPFVTSSNTTAGGAAANLGIDVRKFKIIGITKAYPTRVGEGPFPTELGNYADTKKEGITGKLTMQERKKIAHGNTTLLGKALRVDGKEYGATTGRPRRTGLPDFVALKYAAIANGIDEWAITKIDVLGNKSFKAATAYKKNNQTTTQFPFKLQGWKPKYSNAEYFWNKMTEEETKKICKKGYNSIPTGMKRYIKDLVTYTQTPASIISLGPERNATLTKDVLKKTKTYLKKR